MQPNVLIVEDDAEIASLLTTELGRLGYTLSAVGSGREALRNIDRTTPDLVLLDLGLPDIDGYEVLRQLRETRNGTPVICLTARDQQMDRIGGLRAGADDYIVKPFDVGELDARIRAVLRRSGRAGAQDITVGDLRLLSDGMQVLAEGRAIPLTPRELHVLRRLMKNAGRVVTKQQLTETLSELNEDIGDKTIEVYIHRLRSKLQGHGAEIVTVRGFGYLLRSLSAR
ncbi:MAG TPA: response regulator transcription factor [Casimicrobiaceae bacterium]|nr:response regulator transcription factor [Casimicrobiaceae bacterium]